MFSCEFREDFKNPYFDRAFPGDWILNILGPNLDLCVRQLDAAPFFENYAELYYDKKHLKKVQNRGWGNFWCSFFKQSALLDNIGRCPKFLDSTMYIYQIISRKFSVFYKNTYLTTPIKTTHLYLNLKLTHFSPVFHFYTLWKRQKTILTFSGTIEIEHWAKMG